MKEKFFDGDEDLEWQAMNKAGEGVGDALLRDMRELRTILTVHVTCTGGQGA